MAPSAVTDHEFAGLADLLVRCGAIEHHARVASTRVLSAKPGRRATYHVELRRPLDRLVVKLYDDPDRAEIAAAAIRSLASRIGPGPPAQVPTIVGQVEGVLVFRAVGGRSVDQLLDAGQPELAGRRAGRWLALLHASGAVLDRTLDPKAECQTVQSWLEALAASATVSPHLVGVVERELLAVGPPPPAASVPIHKDFHYGHVFVGSDSATAVVDFDEARMGTPDLDVAHFVAKPRCPRTTRAPPRAAGRQPALPPHLRRRDRLATESAHRLVAGVQLREACLAGRLVRRPAAGRGGEDPPRAHARAIAPRTVPLGRHGALMTVVYLLRSFPRSSQTFVLNEIRTAERLGTEISIAALSPARDAVRQPVADELSAPVTFLDRLLGWRTLAPAVARLLRRRPRAMLAAARAVAADTRVDQGYTSEGRWRCLRHAIVLADQLDDPSSIHLHAHFAHDPAYVASLANRLTGVSFSFTGHARDLYQIDPDALAARVERAAFVVTVTEHNRTFLRGVAAEASTPVLVIPQGTDTDVFTPREDAANGESPREDAANEVSSGDAVTSAASMGSGGESPREDAANEVSSGDAESCCRLLAIGRLVPKKGFDVLIEACADLRASGRRFHCTIVGDGPESETLRRMIADRGLAEHVTLEAERPHADLVELYRSSQVFVLPAIVTVDGDSDALPTVLLEAMACELPVITTPVGGIAELVAPDQDGLLVEPGDPEALAAAIRRLADDPSLGRHLGRTARATVVSRFDHTVGVAQLVELFDQFGGSARPLVAAR